MNFILFVLLLFYVLRDGDRLLAWIMHLSPLSASHENRLLDRIREISKSAIFGILLTSAAQGLTAGIGLAITGIPGLFWGTMTALASLVPVVGTTLILVPAAGYLLLTGHAFKALFLIIWSVVMVGSIDNFLRPWLMQGQSKMSPVILFLAILGGIRAFGLLGLIYGPLVFGLLAIILYIYELEFATYLASQDKR